MSTAGGGGSLAVCGYCCAGSGPGAGSGMSYGSGAGSLVFNS